MANGITPTDFPHGIDITAPGGLTALFDFHRRTFGDAVMEAGGEGGAGGDGGAGTPAGEPAGAPAGDPAGTPAGTPAGDPAGDPAGNDGGQGKTSTPPWGDPANFDAERAWSLIEGLRDDKAKADQRMSDAATKAATDAKNELAQSLGKALGIIPDDAPADPEALLQAATEDRDRTAQERDQAKETARLASIELAIYRSASRHEANVDELLDSRDFASKYAELDPTADDFASKLDAIITAKVEENPTKFKNAQVAPRSGGDFSHGTGGGNQPPANDIDALRQARQERRKL